MQEGKIQRTWCPGFDGEGQGFRQKKKKKWDGVADLDEVVEIHEGRQERTKERKKERKEGRRKEEKASRTSLWSLQIQISVPC